MNTENEQSTDWPAVNRRLAELCGLEIGTVAVWPDGAKYAELLPVHKKGDSTPIDWQPAEPGHAQQMMRVWEAMTNFLLVAASFKTLRPWVANISSNRTGWVGCTQLPGFSRVITTTFSNYHINPYN